jgi:hypothetical protein
MPHVWHGFAFALSEGRDAIERAGAFMAGRFRQAKKSTGAD